MAKQDNHTEKGNQPRAVTPQDPDLEGLKTSHTILPPGTTPKPYTIHDTRSDS